MDKLLELRHRLTPLRHGPLARSIAPARFRWAMSSWMITPLLTEGDISQHV